jgi:hypothetical protein
MPASAIRRPARQLPCCRGDLSVEAPKGPRAKIHLAQLRAALPTNQSRVSTSKLKIHAVEAHRTSTARANVPKIRNSYKVNQQLPSCECGETQELVSNLTVSRFVASEIGIVTSR